MIFHPTVAGTKLPDILRERHWFEHPMQLRCMCGITLRPRTFQNDAAFITKMECGDTKCGKLLYFIDILIDNHPSLESIIQSAGIPLLWLTNRTISFTSN